MTELSSAALDLLRRGTLCYVAAPTREGPHVTPVVFAAEGTRIWITTARGTAKARAWRADPVAAGLVITPERALSFRGRVALHDALDPSTWPWGVRGAAEAVRGSALFAIKNARYFAGYARDARKIPLSWTPPARVLARIEIDAGALLDLSSGAVESRWGQWGRSVSSAEAFRSRSGREIRMRGVPARIRRELGRSGSGALGISAPTGIRIIPVRWARETAEGAYFAVTSRDFLALTGAPERGRCALVMDRSSVWRAAEMRGMLALGDARVFVPERLSRGHASLAERAARAGSPVPDQVVVRLVPDRVVWWEGWGGGTVGRP